MTQSHSLTTGQKALATALAAGVCWAHWATAFRTPATAVAAGMLLWLLAPKQVEPLLSVPMLARGLRGFRRLRVSVVRGVRQRPMLVAVGLFTGLFLLTSLPWRRGLPDIGVNNWHDCESYLVAAKMIAQGRLAMPGLELPDFFRTGHVLVTPIYCSKYPPGYSALLALFMIAGAGWMLPPMLVGTSCAAAWLVGRRVLGNWYGLLGALMFSTATIVVWHGTIQMANTLALLLGVGIVGAWWAQHANPARRVEGGRGGDPLRRAALSGVLTGLLCGVLLLTRPFDAVALSVCLAAAQLLYRRLDRSGWTWVQAAVAGGLPGAAGTLAYHRATTGHWLQPPYTLYEQQQSYTGQFTWEAITPPQDEARLPPNSRKVNEQFVLPRHLENTWSNLPWKVLERSKRLIQDLGPAMMLSPLVVLAPAAARWRRVRPLVWTAAGFFGCYLFYAYYHGRYFAPIFLPLIWLVALGISAASSSGRRRGLELALAFLLAMGVVDAVDTLNDKNVLGLHAGTRKFEAAIGRLPPGPKLIFVRYAPAHTFHIEWVYNDPVLERSQRVTAHDLGTERNAELIRRFPHHTPYLYDEAALRMIALSGAGAR